MAKVTIISIKDGKVYRGKQSKVLSYEEGGAEKSMLVFDPKQLDGMGPGDVVDLVTSVNGKYTNLESITLVSKGAGTSSGGGGGYRQEDPEKQKSISRAVALDKAVTLVTTFGGKIDVEKALPVVLSTATVMFKFLSGEDVDTGDGDFPEV